jgi:hypothetical protein
MNKIKELKSSTDNLNKIKKEKDNYNNINYKEIEDELKDYFNNNNKNNNNINHKENPYCNSFSNNIFHLTKEKIHNEIGTDCYIENEIKINILPLNKNKKCCWNCFKILLEENSIQKEFEEKYIKEKVVKFLNYL